MRTDPWRITPAEEAEMAPLLARHADEIERRARPRGWAIRQIEDVVVASRDRGHVALGMVFAMVAVALRRGHRDRLLRMLMDLAAEPEPNPRRN